ncbi:Crp/Fnr family transcriptional regulator [Chryseobacterium sp.]|uniref:Crp/Fnr family transcriptional regulator n=1 Tax=Chryseobacterium sp. TaxID=1871047 RepID=UPI0025C672A8|nr:Crp/Fnr family transcriptional regulator [Chryseobacterium sp.]
MHDKLLKFAQSIHDFNSAEIEMIRHYFEPVSYPKNTVIEEEGEVPKYLYYIVSGYMRLFHYNRNGDQVTTHINCPPGFFTSYSNFINQKKSEENVECITECELLRISKENLEAFTKLSSSMKNFSIHVFQESIIYHEERAKELSTLSAEQRYLEFLKTYPDIIQNVPVQYIASFLGMKPESLSRIRRKLIN